MSDQDFFPPEMLLQVNKYLECFCLSQEKLLEISARLKNELIRGLEKETQDMMLATFVTATADGTEKGDFLTLDLGGTNFRVQHVHANEKKLEIKSEKKLSIPKEIMQQPGEKLFEYIVNCLGDFLDSSNLRGKTLPLGFTFSFPCKQEAIDKCFLIRWTKGFNCSGVEGKDVVKLLKEAVHKRGNYNIDSVAVVNDTVSTMLSCSHKDPKCVIGMIIGTGTNACYMEEMKNVKYLQGEDGQMCINTEWGGFGDHGSLDDIKTQFDELVNRESINPGVHIFEKMISGMYLGEIARLLLLKLMEDKLLFKGQTPDMLKKPGNFETKFLSEIEMPDKGLENTKKILTSLGLKCELVDIHVVRLVCETISTRSAHLCAAAIATVAERIRENRGLDRLETTVGVDGTLYKEHPNFKKRLQDKVEQLAPKCKITFLDSDGSSGKGAAMAAAVVSCSTPVI
ncbi:hexokinase-2-like [Anabas testudineus]|uniref:hexokinase-2-like n=1 Tax=Anabas testudineus TaxID=64144 RepID=UPI000E461F10|nr:hexokinase-2-like [Anabas testudineus]